jgi:citronellyl-CoA dehydrogenase
MGFAGAGPAHDAFRSRVRAFVTGRLQPWADRWERAGTFPRRVLPACAAQGLLTTDPLRAAIVAEEMPRCESPGLALAVFVQTTLVAPLVERLGTEGQKRDVLRPLLGGRRLAAMAVTEPGAGSDLANLSCTAARRRGGYVLDGVKTYITVGARADLLIVAARSGAVDSPEATLLLVPASARGVRVEPLRTLGLGTSAMGRIAFTRVRVAASDRLGEEGAGLTYVQDALDRERLFGGLACVAWAELTWRKTAAYARTRRAFGRPLTKFQAIRHAFAEIATSLEAARQLNYATFARWLSGERVTREICMIKLFSYEAAQRAVERCLQIHGGAGYLADAWISRFYRDARALTIAAGTPEVMKDLIAAHLRL